MKLFVLIHHYNSTSFNHVEDYKVVGVVDQATKDDFFRKLNMFARDFYDYIELNLNDLDQVKHIMIQ